MISICLSLLLATASPLTHFSDYHYSTLTVTNAALSPLMDAKGYGAPRYADIAFLNEACNERCLAVHVGTDASWTNAYVSATNTVKVLPTMRRPLQDVFPKFAPMQELYMPPDTPLSTVAIAVTNDTRAVTNFSVSVSDEYVTFTNYVTQVMTNGAINVFTNGNRQSDFYRNIVTTQSVTTNALALADLCCASTNLAGWAERYPSNVLFQSYNSLASPNKVIRAAEITNMYWIVRQCRRTRPVSALPLERSVKTWRTTTRDSYGNESTTTNFSSVSSLELYIQNIRIENSSTTRRRDTPESSWTYEDPIESWSISRKNDTTDQDELKIACPFPNPSVFAWCSAGRITGGNGFGVFGYSRRFYQQTSATASDGSVVQTSTNLVYKQGSAVVPLGELSVSGTNLTAQVDISTLATAICAAIGESVPADADPELPPMPDAAYRPGIYTQTKQASRQGTQLLSVNLTSCLLILDIKPNTILSTWSEYNQ